MILGRLFRGLFEAHVVIVATSNAPPDDLYKNGLNRPLFLPFIELIDEHMEVEELLAAKDFRLDKLVGQPLYFTPRRRRAPAHANGSAVASRSPATIRARRSISTSRDASCTCPRHPWAWRASALPSCATGRSGPATSWHIAHAFHTVFVDGIPIMADVKRDVARRFINLIDTLYDNRVCLIASAAAEPDALQPLRDMQFLFERTASRLIEMRSESYLTGRLERFKLAASA